MLNGIGCDICRINRIGEKVISKVLTHNEIKTYETMQGARQQEWLAGRFAAKEAIIKAVGPMSMTSIDIQATEDGKPCFSVGIIRVHLSISHDGEYAMAMAVAESV